MDQYSHPSFNSIMKDPYNRSCFDCNNPHPKWASVNNGTFICINCAGTHRGLGVNISFVRSTTMDSWDEKQLKFLRIGGNKRLRDYMNDYNIPASTEIELKYKLIGLDYYRKMLRSEILNENLPEKPDLINAVERMDEGIRKEKNFDNNQFISSSSIGNSQYFEENENRKKSNGFFGKFGNFFEKTATKIKDMQIADKTKKIIETSSKWVDQKSKKVMDVVYKTKNIFVSEKETGNQKYNKHELNEEIENDSENYSNNNNHNDINLDYNKKQKGNQELLTFFKEENQNLPNQKRKENIDDFFSDLNDKSFNPKQNQQNESNQFDFIIDDYNKNKKFVQKNESEIENIFQASSKSKGNGKGNGNGNLITFQNEGDNIKKKPAYPDFDDFDTNNVTNNNNKQGNNHTDYPSLDNFNFNINYNNK